MTLIITLGAFYSEKSLASQCMDLFSRQDVVEENLRRIPPRYTTEEAQTRRSFINAVEGLMHPSSNVDEALTLIFSALEELTHRDARQTLVREIITWQTSTVPEKKKFADLIKMGYFTSRPDFIDQIAQSALGEVISINHKGPNGQTPILRAASRSRVDLIEALLHIDGINPDVSNQSGATLLMWIAQNNQNHLLPLLPTDSMNINAQLLATGQTAPMMAVLSENFEFLQYISGHPNLDLNLRDRRNLRLYDHAQRSHRADIRTLIYNLMVNPGLL